MSKQFILLDCNGISPGGIFFPALSCNLLSMASYIRENTDWDVRIITPLMDFGCPLDEEGLKCIEDRVVKAVRHDFGGGDRIVFGFSITGNEDIVYALPLAKKLKEAFDASILYGGFGPTMVHRTVCEDYSEIVDAVIVGKGEHVCVELLRQWSNTGPVPDIPGVAAMRDGSFVFRPQPVYKIHPLPDRLHMEIIQNPGYYSTVTYITSYGCRFKCQFCLEQYMNAKCWSKPLDHIRMELETLCRHMRNPVYILFFDALFDFRDNRAAGITDICRDLGVSYFFESRVDTTPFKALSKMREACRAVIYGLEHGSPDMLLRMNKTKNPHKYLKRFKELFRVTTDNDIMAIMSVMINYPGTRRKDVEESIRFFDELFEDYYRRFKPGEGPYYLIKFPGFRQPGNDFLKRGEIREFNETSVTWRPWFENSYRGFPVREKLQRLVKDPSDDIGEDEIKEIIEQIYRKSGILNVDFLKVVEKRFPIMNHRLWLGGDFMDPCLDEENSHVFSMKKMVDLR